MNFARPYQNDPSAELAARELARRRLLDFTTYTFPTYEVSPHLQALAEHLEMVEEGEIDRLMIFMPPRHGKSQLASVQFPAWFLGRRPDKRIILSSYGGGLAQTFSRQVRNLISGPLYGNVFGAKSLMDPPVTIARDSRAIWSWSLERPYRGGLVAAGIEGGITGFGADILIVDDPIKSRKVASSVTARNTIWDWYRSAAYTRLEKGGSVIIIMTRWHEDDLAGRILQEDRDRWVLLHLKALSEDNEALWPTKYSLGALQSIRASIGAREFSALYQGVPQPPEQALFRREWFNQFYDVPPQVPYWVRFWDLALSKQERSNYTVGGLFGLKDGHLYIDDIIRGQWSWPESRRIMIDTALRDGIETVVGLENVAFQALSKYAMLEASELAGFTITDLPITGDKVSRASSWANRAASGLVSMRRASWNAAFIGELLDFPVGEFDDQVDAASGGEQLLGQIERMRRRRSGFVRG